MRYDSLYSILFDAAKKGNCLYRKYSALLVQKEKIISVGYAQTVDGSDCIDCPREELRKKHNGVAEFFEECRVVHAEISAVLNCEKFNEIQGTDLYLFGLEGSDSKIYKNAFPCKNCIRILKYVGVKNIYVFQSVDSVRCYEVII